MPYYRYTIDGEETPWPDKLPEGVSSGPSATPPTPPPDGFGMQALQSSSDDLSSNNMQAVQSVAAPPIRAVMSAAPLSETSECPPYTPFVINMTEGVAADLRLGFTESWLNLIYSKAPSGYYLSYDDTNAALAMANSTSATTGGNIVGYAAFIAGCDFFVPVNYA